MLYFKIAGPAYGCDDIKAYRCVNLEKFDIGICGSHRVFYLLVGYCIFRLHDIIAISCFDLYNDQFIILSCHNIQFEMTLSPVSVSDHITTGFQISYRSSFSGFS